MAVYVSNNADDLHVVDEEMTELTPFLGPHAAPGPRDHPLEAPRDSPVVTTANNALAAAANSDFTVSCLSYYDPYHDMTYAAQYLIPLKTSVTSQGGKASQYLTLPSAVDHGELNGGVTSSRAPVVSPGAVHTLHKPGDGQNSYLDTNTSTTCSFTASQTESNHVTRTHENPYVNNASAPETRGIWDSSTSGSNAALHSNGVNDGSSFATGDGDGGPAVWVPGAGVPGSGVPAPPPGNTSLGPLAALLQSTLNPAWKVDYLDFTPELSGYNTDQLNCDDVFPDLVKKANAWLRQNPQVEVKTCETLTWCSATLQGVGDSESMVLGKAVNMLPGGHTYHVMGVRLWLVPSTTPGLTQNISYRDFKAAPGDSLSALMLRANNGLQEQPLAGKLLSFETVLVPDLDDSDAIYWQESADQPHEYSVLLRLFYAEGEKSELTLGIHNIVPELVRGTHEPFSALMQRASHWISAEGGARVTNLRSTYLTRQNDTPIQAAERCTHNSRDFSRHQYYQILRIFYVCSGGGTLENARKHIINCMTFTPVQSSLGTNVQASFEKMKATMLRIGAWIKLSGAKIFSLETVVTPLIPSRPNHTLPEVTYWSQVLTSSVDDMQWKFLIHIRIYIDGEFIDPDPRLLPPLPYSLTRELQNSIEEKEINRFYKKKKMRKTQNRCAIAIFLFILVTVAIVIIIERMLKKYYL